MRNVVRASSDVYLRPTALLVPAWLILLVTMHKPDGATRRSP
jgi:hypothetical protein